MKISRVLIVLGWFISASGLASMAAADSTQRICCRKSRSSAPFWSSSAGCRKLAGKEIADQECRDLNTKVCCVLSKPPIMRVDFKVACNEKGGRVEPLDSCSGGKASVDARIGGEKSFDLRSTKSVPETAEGAGDEVVGEAAAAH